MPSTIGHGPWGYWPPYILNRLVYQTRPDLVRSKTYKQHWAQLHSRTRFLQAVFCWLGPPSHILWNIFWPWIAHVALAVVIGLTAPSDIRLDIITQSFSFTTFILSLLLAFRINATYTRWVEARRSLAGTGTAVMTLCQQASTWIDDPVIVEDFKRWGIVWLWLIHQCATSASELDDRGKAALYPEELELLTAKGMPGARARQMVQLKFRQLAKEANLPVQCAITMESVIEKTAVNVGDVLRLRFQAMPQALALLSTGFVTLWCLLLPFGLYAVEILPGLVPLVICSAMVSLSMLACDEVAHQMEDPFRLLPVEMIMDVYQKQALEWVREDHASLLASTVAGRLQKHKQVGSAAESGTAKDDGGRQDEQTGEGGGTEHGPRGKPGASQEAILRAHEGDVTVALSHDPFIK